MSLIRYFLVLVFLSSISVASAEGVDINSADATTLSSELIGIGPSKAEAIVQHRQTHGRFNSPESIMDVAGIGQATYEKNKDRIEVSEEEEAEE